MVQNKFNAIIHRRIVHSGLTRILQQQPRLRPRHFPMLQGAHGLDQEKRQTGKVF